MKPAQAARPALSVLIPVLNEAEVLPALLADLRQQRGISLEVLVADGGSSDATASLARHHDARVVPAPRGRAAQLNAAAVRARAPWLLCLHADSRLTQPRQLADALREIKRQARREPLVAGHWPLRFLRQQPGHDALFRHLEAKTASNRTGTVNGDQGLLIHRDALAALGGFDASLPFYEDQRIAARIFAEGRFVLLPGVLETAARRFEAEGHRARMFLMALIVGAEAAGLDDWLRQLPSVYREQQRATRLTARPFLDSLLAHIANLPKKQQCAVWQRAGRLVAGNAWQLAQALDSRRPDSPRWLRLHDVLLAPLFETKTVQQLIAKALPSGLRLISLAV